MRSLNQNELEDVNGGWVVPALRAIGAAIKWASTPRGIVVTTVATTDIPSTPQGGGDE